MSKSLTIFSGSFGHVKGLIDFIRVNEIEHEFYFASHIPSVYKDVPFIRLQSLPAYQNLEFSLNIPLLDQLKLKLENVLPNQRKTELRELISGINPDVLLLDNYNFTDALLLKELKSVQRLPLILYQTRLPTALKSGESKYGGLSNDRFVFLKAQKILKQQRKRRRIHRVTMPYFNDEYKLSSFIDKLNLTQVSLNYERAGMASLSWIPEIILSGTDLSLYHAPNQLYTGLSLSRTDYQKEKNPLLIHVSMGSGVAYSSIYFERYFHHINKLMEYFSPITFSLPLHVKEKIEFDNASYYEWDQYLPLLSSSSVHITMGGINSIKDSLSLGVPCLNCPMNLSGDGVQNALMFKRLGLSHTWNIMKDEISTLIEKIEELLKDDFKERISNYVVTDRERYPVEKVREEFEGLLRDERWEIRNW